IYDWARPFSEGLAAVNIGGFEHGKWGYIDKTGKEIIKLQFKNASGFSEGRAEVSIGKKWGYIDKTGKVVIAPQFDDVWSFQNGLAMVSIGSRVSEKWGWIDKTGKYVWQPTK
ncbi:MAG: WG repeat-containing protein, partial [bacterium]|nr:WG repeat-containing protein [bacterium]